MLALVYNLSTRRKTQTTNHSALQVWGLGAGLTTQSRKKTPVTETATTNPKNNWAPEESSPVEPMMRAGESLREASAQTTLLTAKSKTRMESTRKAKSRKTETDLAQEY